LAVYLWIYGARDNGGISNKIQIYFLMLFLECRRLNCDETLALIGNDDKLLEVLELFIGF
jgi:hypothetical protein